MDIQSTRAYIKSALDEIEDQALLESIKDFLDKARTHPITEEEFYQRNSISRKAIESDSLLAQEEAAEYFRKKYKQS